MANVPEEKVHTKDKLFSYLLDAKQSEKDNSVNVVQCKRTSDRLEQISKHKAVKEKDAVTLTMD